MRVKVSESKSTHHAQCWMYRMYVYTIAHFVTSVEGYKSIVSIVCSRSSSTFPSPYESIGMKRYSTDTLRVLPSGNTTV